MTIRDEFIKKYSPEAHPTMCPLLWNHFSTQTTGEIKFCCEARYNTETHIVDGKIKTMKEIFNSDYYNDARRRMLAGEKLSECEPCWIKEKNGLKSKRLIEWEVLFEQPDNKLPYNFKNWAESSEDILPTYYNLQVSKTCNYACIMCSSDWSSLITSIGQKMGEEKKHMLSNERWWTPIANEDQLDRNEIFWNGLREIAHKLEYLYVTGGEPFIIKPLWNFIKYLVDENFAPKITFWCNTNTSQFNEDQLELLKKFKSVELNLSIDGYGELNEYLRTSSNWNTIEKNIDLAIPNVHYDFKLTLVPVTSGLNVLHLDKLIYWWRNKVGDNNRCVIKPIMLSWPRTMSFNVLPKKFVEQARQSLTTAIDECKLDQRSDFQNVFELLDQHQFSRRANKKLKEEFEYFSQATKKDYLNFFSYLFEDNDL